MDFVISVVDIHSPVVVLCRLRNSAFLHRIDSSWLDTNHKHRRYVDASAAEESRHVPVASRGVRSRGERKLQCVWTRGPVAGEMWHIYGTYQEDYPGSP